jgi:hypothetical protein
MIERVALRWADINMVHTKEKQIRIIMKNERTVTLTYENLDDHGRNFGRLNKGTINDHLPLTLEADQIAVD